VPEAAITLTTGLPPLALVLASALLLFLPGYAAAALLLPAPDYAATERLLAAPALTLALLALLTLWASALHVPLGPGTAVAVLLGSLALLVNQAVRAGGTSPFRHGLIIPEPRTVVASHSPIGTVPLRHRLTGYGPLTAISGYLTLFVLALGLRLWSTRDLLPTLGADTYHHTLIVQLLVERGSLPDSYLPYAPIQSFAYHFGFHSLVAWLHWWTGADVGVLVGLAGHLVNAAVALAVAFFVLRVVGDGLVAALAAWLVALLCVFPAYLVNWGRFTQAAGLLLFPVAAALCIDALRPTANRRGVLRSALAAALVAGGLLLAHYRMAAMLALLVIVWAVYVILRGQQSDRSLSHPARALTRSAGIAARLGAMGLVGGLLALPWLARLPGALSLGLGQQPGDYGADYYGLERLGSAVAQPTNLPLLALAAVGFAVAWVLCHPPAFDKAPAGAGASDNAASCVPPPGAAEARAGPVAVLLLGLWALAQLALANPRWWPIPMPLAGRVDFVTTVAALCFPLAVAAALALATAWRVARAQQGRRAIGLALALGTGATALGGWQLQALVTPSNVLVAPADLTAAAWLRAHAPPDARIAVSAVIFPWAPDYVVGVDGGYWLPLLAGRATTVLPMLYPGERAADPQAVAAMVAATRALLDAPAAPQTVAVLRALGVGYVYHSGRSPVPSGAGLAENQALRLEYAEGGVRIWQVAPE
jgi:hypothetical protein